MMLNNLNGYVLGVFALYKIASTNLLVSEQSFDIINVTVGKTHRNVGYANFENLGILGCVKKCLQRTDCLAFTHSRDTLKCELFDRSLQNGDLKNEQNSVYSQRESWDKDKLSDCGSLTCNTGSSCYIKNGTATCIVTECGMTPPIANGATQTVGRSLGYLASYICDPETVLEGTPTRRCTPTGEWQPDTFICHLQCPDAPVVPDAILDDPLRIVGIYTNYTCTNDTVLYGTPSLYCQENQTWTPVEFDCIRQCPDPPVITDAFVNATVRILGTIITYSCDPRADMFGTPTLECQNDQTWSNVTFECIRQCPDAPNVTHAIRDTEVKAVGISVNYTCINDTFLDGNPVINCEGSQGWTSISFSCLEQCPFDEPVVPFANPNSFSRLIGDVKTFNCFDTYDLVGAAKVTCQSDRHWTPVTFECIPACPTPPDVPNATPNSGPKFVNSTITYQCISGHDVIGTPEIFCETNQNWTIRPFECNPACPVPSAKPNATISYDDGHKFIGNNATYTCDPETIPDGSPSITCQPSQQWSSSTFKCHKQCPLVPEIAHATPGSSVRIVGTIVNYTCDGEYVADGTPLLSCQPNQQWTNINFECELVCPPPKEINFTEVTTSHANFIGSIATYECTNDRLLRGTSTVTCQANQTWSSEQFVCLKQCPVSQPLPNATPTGTSRIIGAEETYICNPGYAIVGIPTLLCQANQTWTPVLFQCDPVCPVPPAKSDATVTYDDKFVGSNATYSCAPETVPEGSPVISCEPNQQWSSSTFTCHRQCPTVPTLPHATANTTVRIVGIVVDFHCNGEYVADGTPELTCMPGQKWSSPNFQCKLVCQPPPNLNYTTVSTSNYNFVESIATYTCTPDRLLDGNPDITCQNNQEWSAVGFICLEQCPLPPVVPNAAPVTDSRIIGANVTYRCNDGYKLVGENQILDCQSDQTWTNVTFECNPVCTEPLVIENATVVYADKFVGSNATYSCDPETVPDGSPIVTCQATQQWSISNFQCIKQCPGVPDVPNATANTTIRIINTVVDYVCNTGYVVDGTPQLTCQTDQMWTSVDFACKLECPEPQNITDTTINYPDKFVGSNATYSCDPETVPDGAPMITCQTDQQWSTTDFQCLKQCPVVPDVPNATANTTLRIINTVVDYVCNTGYVVVGTPQLTCQADQMWTSVDFECKLECPEPQTISNATVNYADKFVGSNATYSCDPETFPDGSPIITCQTDQQWSASDFQCLKQCPGAPDVPNATANTTVRTIKTVVDYVCNTGYVVDGTPQLTCQPDQTWTSVDFVCKLECPEPQTISNATVNYADKFVGSNATYSCDLETVPDGFPIITCQTDQQWSVSDFQCLKQCPVVPDVPNAAANTTVRIINTVVDYVCNTGYVVDGSPQLTCQPDQTWTSINFECKLECPVPQDITNSTVNYPDKFVGSNATYSCDPETVPDGSPIITCQADQQWSASDFQCLKQCPRAPGVPNATANTTVRIINTVVDYVCNTGYVVDGTPQLTCQPDQTWTSVEFACKLECPEPQTISNATVNYADKFVGSNATYFCDPETVPDGSPIITCQADQQWSVTDFQCLKQCPIAPDVPNAIANTTVRIINTVVDYVCNTGYVVDGTPQLTCQTDQMWTSVDFACKLECPVPQDITNSTVNYPDKFVGSNATYSCDPETVPDGSPIITCQADQQWSATDFQCLKQCPRAPDVPNATANTTVRIINTVVGYVCNNGYVVDGSPQLTCQPDQKWTSVDFACKLECPEPQTISNATVNYADKFVGSNATYSCDPETVPDGSPFITCQTDQQWSATDFQCLKQCPVVPDVPNATANTTMRIINTVVHYVCNTGYVVDGTPQLTCQTDQMWTSVDFACKLECPVPQDITNSTINYPDKFVGSNATYSCDPETVPDGSPIITCQADQQWSVTDFQCLKQCPVVPDVPNATTNTTVRIIHTVVGYVCNTGYVVDGTPQLTCQPDQMWTNVDFACKLECPEPQDITNATVNYADKFIGSNATYSCDPGTIPGGSPIVTCQTDQQWSTNDFHCFRQCPVVPDVPNATANITVRIINTVVGYVCNTGYVVDGSPQLTCQPDQTWTSINFECKLECPEPPTIVNATVSYPDKFVGSTATYVCVNGRTQSGNPDVLCQVDQTWTSSSFSCTTIT